MAPKNVTKSAPDTTAPVAAPEAPPGDPIEAKRDERTKAEAGLAEALAELSVLSAKGDIAGCQAAMSAITVLNSQIGSLTREISEMGFAVSVDAVLRIALAERLDTQALVKACERLRDVPKGDVRVQALWQDGSFQGATYVRHQPSVTSISKAKPKGAKREAALTSEEAKTGRPNRYPPAGVVLGASLNSSWSPDQTPTLQVEFTEGLGVIISGTAADGTRFERETFARAGEAGKRLLGHTEVNVYRWLGLGDTKHKAAGGWIGHQVTYK